VAPSRGKAESLTQQLPVQFLYLRSIRFHPGSRENRLTALAELVVHLRLKFLVKFVRLQSVISVRQTVRPANMQPS